MGFYEIEQRKIDKQVIIKIMGSTGLCSIYNIIVYCAHHFIITTPHVTAYDTVVGFLKLLSHLNILLLKNHPWSQNNVGSSGTVNMLWWWEDILIFHWTQVIFHCQSHSSNFRMFCMRFEIHEFTQIWSLILYIILHLLCSSCPCTWQWRKGPSVPINLSQSFLFLWPPINRSYTGHNLQLFHLDFYF